MPAVVSLSANGHNPPLIDDGTPDSKLLQEAVMPLADPLKPLMDDSAVPPRGRAGRIVLLGGALFVVLLLAAAWKLTPLGTVTNREALAAFLAEWQGWSAAPLVIAMFVVGGLIAFPVVLLMLATAAAVHPAIGLPSAFCGILMSAALLFAIGRRFGEQAVRNIAGSRFQRVRDMLLGNGVLAIALVRMIPILPFSLVNLAAGALRIRLADFLLGTLLGMAPGLIAIFALGATLSKLLREPSASNIVLVIVAAAVWLMLVVFSQYAIRRMSRLR
jgi:phospholipase D1/2